MKTIKKKPALLTGITASAALSTYSLIIQSDLRQNVLLYILIFVTAFAVIYAAASCYRRRAACCGLALGTAFSLSLILGKTIYDTDTVYPAFASFSSCMNSLICFAGLTILFGGMSAVFFAFIQKHTAPPLTGQTKSQWKFFYPSRRTFLQLWMIIFICWLPVYLAYYPGTLAYDMYLPIGQAVGVFPCGQLCPFGCTALFWLCYRIEILFGVSGLALVIYLIFQMLLLSAAFACCLNIMAKHHFSNGVMLFTLLFFALCPTNALMSFASTKDIIYSALFIFTVLQLLEMISDDGDTFFKSKKKIILFYITSIAAMFFCKSAIGVYVPTFFVTIILIKKNRKKILLLSISILMSYVLIHGPVLQSLGVGLGIETEALSLPLNQIANVCGTKYDELTDDEYAMIDRFNSPLYIAMQYNPRFADPVKSTFFQNDNYDRRAFIKLWLKLGIKYPAEYLNSFLCLNLGSWYISTPTPDPLTPAPYIATSIIELDYYRVQSSSMLECLRPIYDGFADFSKYAGVSIFATVMSTAFPFWLALFCLISGILLRKRSLMLLATAPLALWIICLTGPVVCLRYVYPSFALYPVLACAPFKK